jgi:hypothetical protein
MKFFNLTELLFSDFAHRPETRFGNWICFRPQVRGDTYSVGSLRRSYSQSMGPNRVGVPTRLRTETDYFQNVAFFLSLFRIRPMDKVQKLSNSVCYIPSSKPYRIYFFNLSWLYIHMFHTFIYIYLVRS